MQQNGVGYGRTAGGEVGRIGEISSRTVQDMAGRQGDEIIGICEISSRGYARTSGA